MMEEAQRIFDYLPVSYRDPAEKEDVEFLWDAFLIESQNPDEREFLDDESQIKEIFVPGNYLSFEDIKIAQHYDISVLSVETGFANIQSLVQKLEREIDRLVYKLYDLTEEEIRIVEKEN